MLPTHLVRVIVGMNQHISLKRVAFLAAALGAMGATAAFADSASTTPTDSTGTYTPGAGGRHHHHHHKSVLSAAERAELKKDREAVFASNPSLKTQEDNLHAQFNALKSQATPATSAQWEALKTQHEALKTQMRTAIEGVDSGAAAIFQKLDAAHAAHQHSS